MTINHATSEKDKDFLHVLILGNGFDLAHGLETKYTDFSNSHGFYYNKWFTRFILTYLLQRIGILKKNRGNWFNLEQEIYDFILNPYADHELIEEIDNNYNNILGQLYYIDGGLVITFQVCYTAFRSCTLRNFLRSQRQINDTTATKQLYESSEPHNGSLYGLRSFIKAFAEYLSQTVPEKIKDLAQTPKFHFCLKELEEENTHPQKHTLWVLNFNYTPTFQKLYEPTLTKRGVKVHHCHIHGSLGEESLVLGCQSFDPEDEIDPAWNVFTKHHQRHRYGTIEKYQELLKELSRFKGEVAFHIIGHSLDHADHAILKHALCSSHNTAVQDSFISVYYHDEEAHLRLINTITSILGEEDAMARVRFIDQHDPKRGILRRIHETSKNQ